MKSSALVLLVPLLAILTLLAGCKPSATPLSNPPGPATNEKLRVHVVNYPLAYFAERIGGNLVDVAFNVPPDEDPAFWEPSDAIIAAFQNADLILLNGANYARWLNHVSLPQSPQVDTSAAFADQFVESDSSLTHSHGKEGEHSHGGIAFTTWLDFTLAAKQAAAIRDALKEKLPGEAASLDARFASLESDLQSLDSEMAAIGRKLNGQPLLASHPIYQYLARRYHLNLQSVLWEPNTHPSVEEWQVLDRVLAGHAARLMLWEGPPHPNTAKALNERGITPVIFSQAGNRPDTGDFLFVMRAGIQNLEKAAQ